MWAINKNCDILTMSAHFPLFPFLKILGYHKIEEYLPQKASEVDTTQSEKDPLTNQQIPRQWSEMSLLQPK